MSELYQRKCTKPSEVSFFHGRFVFVGSKMSFILRGGHSDPKTTVFFSEILGVVVVNKRRCKLAETWMYVYSEIKL